MPNNQPVNIKGFFEKGWTSDKDWTNANALNLPAKLKYMSHETFDGKFGTTEQYFFQNKDGSEVRLLCKSKTFRTAVEKFLATGDLITLLKNEKGWWYFLKYDGAVTE